MAARQGLVYGLHAVMNFLGASGGGSILRARGFADAFTRNGAGDYTFTCDSAIDTTGAQHGLIGQAQQGAMGSTIDAAIVTATTVRVRTGATATGTDMQFTISIIDLGLT